MYKKKLMIGSAYGLKYSPPSDYVINQWSGTFIYNILQVIYYNYMYCLFFM